MATPRIHDAPRRTRRPGPARAGTKDSAPANSDSSATPAATFIEPERRHAMISDAAYFLSEGRDFRPGRELDDWLTAEREIDHLLTRGGPATGRGTSVSFESNLRARSQQLRTEIRDTLLRADAEQYAHIAGEVHDAEEDALADLLVDVNLAEISRDVQEFRDIDAALQRIATRTYGVCIQCGELIDGARLNAYPTAKRCLPCQRLYDRSKGTALPPSL
jgi:DnaK suppressor protein